MKLSRKKVMQIAFCPQCGYRAPYTPGFPPFCVHGWNESGPITAPMDIRTEEVDEEYGEDLDPGLAKPIKTNRKPKGPPEEQGVLF